MKKLLSYLGLIATLLAIPSTSLAGNQEEWYLHSNLDNDWSGETNYSLSYNPNTGFYERTLTEAEINNASNDDVRFRVYDGNSSWGPSSTYAFSKEGTESQDLTLTSTNNYLSFPKNVLTSAKIQAKKDGSKVVVYVTLNYFYYYWVSPQITNGEKWEYFKMVPSRNRNMSGGGTGAADGKISTKYYTFTLKNEDLVTWKSKSAISNGTKIQWYIVRNDDAVFFRPESNNPAASAEGTSIAYGDVTDNAVGYRNFTSNYKTTDATRTGYFEFNKGYNNTSNSVAALAYTFMINSDNGNVYLDYAHSPASTTGQYDLVGNFSNAKGSVSIDLYSSDYRKDLTKYWYKGGTGYDFEHATSAIKESCDSIVYKVEVQKPDAGWGDLYIDVIPDGSTNWSEALRPLISLGNNLDGRALHGALTTAKSEQSLNPEPSDNYQSYTFSFNATTRTYNLEFNMPDATLSPGYDGSNMDFDNTWSKTITVNYSEATEHATAATKCYIKGGSSTAITLDGETAKDKASFTEFVITYDGTAIYMDGTKVADGNTVYFKIRGEDASGDKGEIHTYQYTFTSTMSFEPHGGLFINSAKITINGGMPPYRYEIWHYNTKTENGEEVIDYDTNPTKLSEGTFSTGTYANSDNNYRISTPGFLKIIDNTGTAMSYDEVGGGFDFTYSTSENYIRNTGAAITTIDEDDAGAYPNGADYWLARPDDLTRLVAPTSNKSNWSYSTGDGGNISGAHWSGDTSLSYLHIMDKTAYQTINGLAAGTYTVQAIVRGDALPVYLDLNDTQVATVQLTSDAADAKSTISPEGRCEQLENRMTKGWHKLEGKTTLSAAGNLKIAIRTHGGGSIDIADVILLKDANTTTGFRTTASTSPEDITTYDYRRRQVSGSPSQRQNNAYSFFDRGKNQNAVIFANENTVIAMNSDLLADDAQNTTLKATDRRHPFNVVACGEDDSKLGTAKALYLSDSGYDDSYLPVELGTSGDANYNSDNYRTRGYSFCPGLAFYAEDLIFDRNMSQAAAKKTTCMLPISITPGALKTYFGNDLKVYKFTSLSDKDLTFTQQYDATALNANEPYIYWGAEGKLDTRGKTAGKTDGKFTVGAITSTDHNAAAAHSGFPGTYAYKKLTRYGKADGTGTSDVSQAAETRFIYSASKGVFSVVSTNGANLKPFRAYFVLPVTDDTATPAPLNVIFDDEVVVTGIDNVESTEAPRGDVYTVSGMLVAKDGDLSRLAKGIYIVNGKKYVVK